MRSRALRLSVTLLAVVAIAAAAYLTWIFDTRLTHARSASAAFESARLSALHDAFELRSAQQAYVASGQSDAFWFGKVTASLERVRGAIDALASASASRQDGRLRASLDTAAQALVDFEDLDRRARGYAAGGQDVLASDTIFSDGLETSGRLIAALHEAGAALVQVNSIQETDARRQRWLTSAAAAALALVSLLLLLPRGRVDARAAQETGRPPAAVASAPAVPKPRLTAPVPPRQPTTAVEQAAPPAPAAAPSAELSGLAAICTDLARLSDTRSLPAVLERAASTLDASGLVLWVADPDGTELIPVAAHGYPLNLLARMGSLKADAENATAAAFRTGMLQTVDADTVSNGAIAAPLVTAAGCRGVMSAEVRNGGEKQPARLAAATIVAAQLATLIGPAVRAQDRNTAAV